MSRHGLVMRGCYHSPTEVFVNKKQSITYYAADESRVSSFKGDCIINLTSTPGIRAGSTTYKIPQLSKHMINLPEEIVLTWHDFSTPPVEFTFWEALDNYLDEQGYNSVCFHCKAGHGRTGTALCSMMISNLGYAATTAIKEIRKNYCHLAVESSEQIAYLLSLDADLNEYFLPNEKEIESLIYDLTPDFFPNINNLSSVNLK